MRMRLFRRAAAVLALVLGVGLATPAVASAAPVAGSHTVQTAGDWWW